MFFADNIAMINLEASESIDCHAGPVKLCESEYVNGSSALVIQLFDWEGCYESSLRFDIIARRSWKSKTTWALHCLSSYVWLFAICVQAASRNLEKEINNTRKSQNKYNQRIQAQPGQNDTVRDVFHAFYNDPQALLQYMETTPRFRVSLNMSGMKTPASKTSPDAAVKFANTPRTNRPMIKTPRTARSNIRRPAWLSEFCISGLLATLTDCCSRNWKLKSVVIKTHALWQRRLASILTGAFVLSFTIFWSLTAFSNRITTKCKPVSQLLRERAQKDYGKIRETIKLVHNLCRLWITLSKDLAGLNMNKSAHTSAVQCHIS